MEKVKYFQNYIVPGVPIFRNDCSKYVNHLKAQNDNILLYITKILNGN